MAGRHGTMRPGLPPAQFRGRIGLDGAIEPARPLCVPRQLRCRQAATRGGTGRIQPADCRSRIKAAEIYRTDDKGATWRKVSDSNDMSGHSGTYGWVFRQIRVDPTDENTIYTLGLDLNVSRDAGKTFSRIRVRTAIIMVCGSIRPGP